VRRRLTNSRGRNPARHQGARPDTERLGRDRVVRRLAVVWSDTPHAPQLRQHDAVIRFLEDRRVLLGCGRQVFADRVEASDDCGDRKHYGQESLGARDNDCPPASFIALGAGRTIVFIDAAGKDDNVDPAQNRR
jgi:hypothetical protein